MVTGRNRKRISTDQLCAVFVQSVDEASNCAVIQSRGRHTVFLKQTQWSTICSCRVSLGLLFELCIMKCGNFCGKEREFDF